jgi:hypothetical protein
MSNQREFLAAFKEIFWYQARRKFGLLPEMNIFEKWLRPSLILFYILLLYYFTQNHHEVARTLLTVLGCTWLSATAMDSMKQIYHRRCTVAENPNGFRDIGEFTSLEKLFTYLIPAFILTGIFAGGLFFITFIRTGDLNVDVFIGMVSIPFVILFEW